MFGWRYYGRTTGEDREGRTYREVGFSIERMENVVWVRVSLWRWAFHWRKLDALRETGPEDNANVVRAFFGGPERRTKSKDFRSGFAEAAAKGPVPTISPALGAAVQLRHHYASKGKVPLPDGYAREPYGVTDRIKRK